MDEAGLDKRLTELVKRRVLQVNDGCADCARLHLSAARRAGGGLAKSDLAAAGRDDRARPAGGATRTARNKSAPAKVFDVAGEPSQSCGGVRMTRG